MGGRFSKPKPKPRPKPGSHKRLTFGTSGSEPVCFICYSPSYTGERKNPGGAPWLLMEQGCGCRDAGAATMCHVPCALEWHESTPESAENRDRFSRCRACNQLYSGPFKMGVAKARLEHVKNDHIASQARLTATVVLAHCLTEDGAPDRALGILNGLYAKLAEEDSNAPFLVDILAAKAAALHMLGPSRTREHTDTLYVILNSGLPENDQAIMEANYQRSMALVDNKGDLNLAVSCAKKARDASIAMKGHNEGRQITYANNYASVLSAAARRECDEAEKAGRARGASAGKQFAKALSILDEISAQASLVFGADHELSMKVKTNAATVIVHSGAESRYEEAIENIRKAYEVRLAKLGPDHQRTADSLQNLRGVLLRTGGKCPNPACKSLVSVLGSKVRCLKCTVARYCCAGCLDADKARHAVACLGKSARKKTRP